MGEKKYSIQKIIYIGVMAAIVCVITFFRFPLLGSKVHFANAMCLLSGLLLGGVPGGIAAGLGSFLYDALFGGYDIVQCLITFVSKFAMAFVCAKIANVKIDREAKPVRIVVASIIGALSYVALYMLKTFIFGMWVNGLGMDGTLAKMGTKLPGSLINALFASVAGPAVFLALKPALRHAGLLEKM